jgi:hypothetical protein
MHFHPQTLLRTSTWSIVVVNLKNQNMNDQQQQQQQHQCVQSKLIPRTFTWRVPRSQIDDMFAASTKTGDKQHHSSAIFEL